MRREEKEERKREREKEREGQSVQNREKEVRQY